ncbi:DUF916 domain-containing protein [Arthrobacter sp. zg-Y40]|uniref:WxL protein peptidoglycan domain-containing protein n=1 Tax=Arthrobacter sp. zg-Y40 TaxID=2886939 RepID=UPI001D14C8EF|nr:DUF916 domain-containing protein [Arthrobacter sp. zg-Y40]
MNASLVYRRPRRRALRVAALAALAILLPAFPAHAEGPDDVTWTVRTASNDLGADRTTFTYTVDPGGSLTDAMVITNRGDEPVALSVYAADGFTSDDGELSLLVAGETSQAVGSWITAETKTVTIGPDAATTIPFTVDIPANATPGDYVGGLVTSLTVPDAPSGVSVDRRLGIRVNLRVGGDLAPSLAVEDLSVSWNGGWNPFAGGDAAMTYTLHNTGNAALSVQPADVVSGPFGWFPVDAAEGEEVPELLPGESWTRTVTVDGILPLFVLLASTTVTPVMTDASGSTTPLAEVSGTAVGAAIPWTAMAIILLLAAATYLYIRRRRHRIAAEKEREDERVNAAVAQALEGDPVHAAASKALEDAPVKATRLPG